MTGVHGSTKPMLGVAAAGEAHEALDAHAPLRLALSTPNS